MTHEDQGHYARKHPGVQMDPKINQKIKLLAGKGSLTCADAHRAAGDLAVSPAEIGIQTDLMELRISQCQMGLFGHGKDHKKIDPSIEVDEALWSRLEKTGKNGRISCAECWEIALEFKMKKLDIGSACEKLGLRVKPCQLGAF
ncbi:hypothetical protein [Desulfospira joergensenii]|uniref:hypothetical protein n=1 Tax=Desulfospira joergensenii TaxID=53329 RepID=UPI0003B6340B|nr:hypothetical protein [Desulfospira joergensenii]